MENELLEKIKSYLKDAGASNLMELVAKGNLTLYDIWEILRNFIPSEEAYDTINNIAREFIKKEAKDDIFIFERMFIQKLNEINLKNRDAILNFLNWIINFCKDLSELNFGQKLELCSHDTFLEIIKNEKLFYSEEEVKSRVVDAYLEILSRAKRVCEDIEKCRFINAYLHYVKILKTSFELIALLSVESVQELSKEAKTDPLTGLLNRRYMHLILKDIIELSSITDTPFTIALIDIDDFKRINDTYGHLAGDCIIKELAILLRNTFRKGDYIFRYGGEEFLVVMPSTSLRESVKILERFRSIVERHTFSCEGKKLHITVSIGICSEVPKGDKSILDYIKCADFKLYEAKKTGKNRVIF